MPTSGPELRRERRAAEVAVQAMAVRMGVSRQAIHNWEKAAVVMPNRVAEYRAALVALRDAREAALG